MKNHGILILLWSFSTVGFAQDLDFSQYQHSTLFINPGRLGADLPVLEVHYRLQPTQISSVDYFSTTALSMTYPLLFSRDGSPKFTLGFSLFYHQQLQDMNTYGGLLGLSYGIPLKKNKLYLGLQGGLMQTAIGNNIVFADQFDQSSATFRSPMGNSETSILPLSNLYPTFGLGLHWTYQNRLEQDKFFLGISGLNINQPPISLIDGMKNRVSVPINWNVSGGMYLRNLWNSKFFLTPNFRWLGRLGNHILQIGSWLSYKFTSVYNNQSKQNTLQLGAWYRSNQVFVLGADVQFNQYRASFSYDLGLEKESAIWLDNGALEFTLGISINKKGKRKKPKIRIDSIQSHPLEPYLGSPDTLTIQPRFTRLAIEKPTITSDNPPALRLERAKLSETIFDTLILFYETHPDDFQDLDWTKINDLVRQLYNYPTRVLIVSEVRGLASTELDNTAAYELAKKLKGYLMTHTSLRENDIVIQFNRDTDSIILQPSTEHQPIWGLRITPIIQE